MGFHIGAKIKSIPSRLASFAAGIKSPSPAIKTILSTCFLNAIVLFTVSGQAACSGAKCRDKVIDEVSAANV